MGLAFSVDLKSINNGLTNIMLPHTFVLILSSVHESFRISSPALSPDRIDEAETLRIKRKRTTSPSDQRNSDRYGARLIHKMLG